MKNIYLALCLFAFAITSCEKTVIKQATGPATGVQLKFFHAAPGTPALDAFVNGVQVTPTGSTSLTDNAAPSSIVTGYSYLGIFPGVNYSVTASGSTVVKIVTSTPVPALVSKQTSLPAATVGSVTQNTTDGTAYSVFTIGLPGSASAGVTTMIVPDKFPDPVSGKAYIRLAALIPNATTGVDLVGIYTPIGGTATSKILVNNIKYPNVTDFTAVDMNPLSTTSYTFQLYLTGTTTKIGAVSASIALTPGRFYTIIGRGLAADYVVPGAGITLKATARPTLPTSDPTTKFPEIYFNIPGISYYTNK
ncbi:MAG: DUF4397 domain-containing protein [Sphingobacteriaceae bacterium]|nr:MAG: DUF4397 domain-containing protein [Sphingobacteriaceae bacterium]